MYVFVVYLIQQVYKGGDMSKYQVMLYGTFAYRGTIKAKNLDEVLDKVYAELDDTNFEIDDIHNDEIEKIQGERNGNKRYYL